MGSPAESHARKKSNRLGKWLVGIVVPLVIAFEAIDANNPKSQQALRDRLHIAEEIHQIRLTLNSLIREETDPPCSSDEAGEKCWERRLDESLQVWRNIAGVQKKATKFSADIDWKCSGQAKVWRGENPIWVSVPIHGKNSSFGDNECTPEEADKILGWFEDSVEPSSLNLWIHRVRPQ